MFSPIKRPGETISREEMKKLVNNAHELRAKELARMTGEVKQATANSIKKLAIYIEQIWKIYTRGKQVVKTSRVRMISQA